MAMIMVSARMDLIRRGRYAWTVWGVITAVAVRDDVILTGG
jgi:hypothetical protein